MLLLLLPQAPVATTKARLTQQVVESLQQGTSAARSTQQVIEALTQGAPAARVTQQVIEVLMQTGNWARLTQQYIEALTNAPINRDGSDTITVTESNSTTIVPGGSEATDTIVFTETNVTGFLQGRSASDTLTLTESNTIIVGPTFGYTDTIVFTETNSRLRIPHYSYSDTITITETNARYKVIPRSANDPVGYSETNQTSKAKIRSGSDTVAFNEMYFGERHTRVLIETIVFTESTVSLRILSRSATDTIVVTETYSKQNILLRSTVDSVPVLENVPRIVGGLTIVVPSYIGTVVGGCDEPQTKYCILQGMNHSVVLPNPQFDDSEANMDTLQVFRTATNRRVITVKRQDLRTLNYTFRLTRQKAIELRTLIRTEIDNQVTWRNWKGEIWVGTIGTNPFNVTADGRWGECTEGMSVELELKAVRIH